MSAHADDATQPLLRLVNVDKTFKTRGEKVQVLSHFDVTIHQGDFIAIMGPSGSGKSTLLNLLGGLDRPTGGEIWFRDEKLSGYGDRKMAAWRARNIGFVFQSYNLIPILTAVQNVEIPLLLTSLSRKQRRENARTALELVGLSDRANYLPRKMSGGQQQRVAIARAIVSDPTMLICDEPTGNLDRATADELLSLLSELNSRHGKTIVMATHDPAAARFAKSTLALEKGRLTERMAAQ